MKRFFSVAIITAFTLFIAGCCTIDKTQFPTQRNFQSDIPAKSNIQAKIEVGL